MIRAGLIGAGVSLVYVMSFTLLSPLCTLLITPLLGVGAGYLAGWFNKPLRVEAGLKGGAVAGFLTGVGAIAGQMLAGFVNAVLVTNSESLPQVLDEIGFSQFASIEPAEYWRATFLLNSLCGTFNVALIVGLGALGGMIWVQRHHENSLSTISAP